MLPDRLSICWRLSSSVPEVPSLSPGGPKSHSKGSVLTLALAYITSASGRLLAPFSRA